MNFLLVLVENPLTFACYHSQYYSDVLIVLRKVVVEVYAWNEA